MAVNFIYLLNIPDQGLQVMFALYTTLSIVTLPLVMLYILKTFRKDTIKTESTTDPLVNDYDWESQRVLITGGMLLKYVRITNVCMQVQMALVSLLLRDFCN